MRIAQLSAQVCLARFATPGRTSGSFRHTSGWRPDDREFAYARADRLRQRLPLEMSGDGRQISRGAVFTNDPAEARAFVGVLAVAEEPPADELLLAADADDG